MAMFGILLNYGHVNGIYPISGVENAWMILCQPRPRKDLSKQKGLGYDEQDAKRK